MSTVGFLIVICQQNKDGEMLQKGQRKWQNSKDITDWEMHSRVPCIDEITSLMSMAAG